MKTTRAAAYAELAAMSNFSFLEGASHPDEMVLQAKALGLAAIGIADRNTLAGVVRAHLAAREAGIRLLVGTRLVTADGADVVAYPMDRDAYGRLCRLLTLGKRRAVKGACDIALDDVVAHGADHLFVVMPPARPGAAFAARLERLSAAFPGAVHLGATLPYGPRDHRRLHVLADLARRAETPLVAVNDARYHVAGRRVLADVLTCIREHCTIDAAGRRLDANAERHLKPAAEMARLFAGFEDAVARTVDLAARCRFSLDELAYDYPDEPTGDSASPQEELERLVRHGAAWRYPEGVPERVAAALSHELALVAELDYAPYFLTVHDIVRFARARNILCQGRGSAANSAICFCLGITSVDPAKVTLLFERFISRERNEPPDIDVDFEHERREEVVRYIYEKYGRERAGIAATVITYRGRSAVREVGKALGLSLDAVGALSSTVWGWSSQGVQADHVREAGLDPGEERIALALRLSAELIGFPRHLSQHTGGWVITRGPLEEVVPIGNAAMEGRTFVEWDKDDLDALGILKIDVLALGMLSCLRRAFDLLAAAYGRDLDLARIPADDSRVYDMICRADTLGVFQIESRAQMSMLPRLKPRTWYDLVIEVAIVRPGPIQGDMVHPFLRRRNGEEPVEFPAEELRSVLGKTLGVPLFQEQAMQLAITAAGFSAGEADALRRAMATFRKSGLIHRFADKFVDGMIGRGYEPDFARRCFKQIEGFSTYGFPESHAASFALLVYASSWLKCHYPDVFACALLNAQPMGFYAPAQIVRDLRDHGGGVRPVDVNRSDWDCTLEEDGAAGRPTGEGGNRRALRLGLRQIKGFREDDAAALVAARGAGYPDIATLQRQAGLAPAALARLAEADAFRSLGLDRRAALWAIEALGTSHEAPRPVDDLPLFRAAAPGTLQREAPVRLKPMGLGEEVVEDYRVVRMSLKAHPVSFLRARFARHGVAANRVLEAARHGDRVKLAGIVLVRQRPGSAKGVIFITIEDETGIANLVVWPDRFERFRKIVMSARLLGVEGKVQREGLVVHVVVDRLHDLSDRLELLSDESFALNDTLANADEVRRPAEDPREAPYMRAVAKTARAARILPKGRNFH